MKPFAAPAWSARAALGFPTHVKLAVTAERVIVNGAECEPLLRVDQLAMQRQADKVVRGLTLAMEAAHAPEGVIATKEHYGGGRSRAEACDGRQAEPAPAPDGKLLSLRG